jgi:hypothetical protein
MSRDFAMMALTGAIAGAQFGAESSALAVRDPFEAAAISMQSYQYGADPPQSSPYGANFGDYSGFGYGGFGVDAPGAPPAPHAGVAPPPPPGGHPGMDHRPAPPNPHPHELARVWHEHHARQHHEHLMAQHQMHRELLLDPNKYSRLKVERYSFTLVQAFTWQITDLLNTTLNPACKMRPDRIVTNVSIPFMIEMSSLQIANVNVLIGGGEDAWVYNPMAQNVVLQLPTVEPAYRVTLTGDYTGTVPQGFSLTATFNFRLGLQGWAVLAGNG